MKKLSLLTALLLVFVLAGCQKENGEGKSNLLSKQEQSGEAKGKLDMSKMKKAMKKGKQIKCVDKSTEEVSNVFYIKGDKYRLESTFNAAGQEFHTYMVSDGKTVYNWNDKAKDSGTKFELDCMESIKKDMESEENETIVDQFDFKDSDKMVEEIDEEDDQTECVLDSSEVDFTPPSDVKFADQCEQFKQMAESMKQMKKSAE